MHKAAVFILSCSFFHCMASDWSYDGDDGPKNWPKMFPLCDGKRQSPIDIRPKETNFSKSSFENNYAGKSDDLKFSLVNNGHSAQVNIENADGLLAKAFGSQFKPVQVHFHWGREDTEGSEHMIGGTPFAAEMHFVHMNENYSSPEEALKEGDGLLVLGTFIKVGIETGALNPIFEALEDIEKEGENREINGLDISKLMSTNQKEFYFYDGSLTTPKCNEAVKWIVFKEELSITSEQMEKLRSLKHDGSEGDTSISNNYRPTQPLNKRMVKRTFSL